MSKPFKRPAKNKEFDDWPYIGEILLDTKGRILRVIEVNPDDKLGRNIVGVLQDNTQYATSVEILLLVWERS